jgi:hypothetical protein
MCVPSLRIRRVLRIRMALEKEGIVGTTEYVGMPPMAISTIST